VYDPAQPGKIRWDQGPETGKLNTRPLAIIEANDALLFSAGNSIYRRSDGLSPAWKEVYTLGRQGVVSAMGGIRGLTRIDNPTGNGDSLLFMDTASVVSRGCVHRLDPDGRGGYNDHREVCLAELVSEHLDGAGVIFILGAYSGMFPVTDPETRKTAHLIGFESLLCGRKFPSYKGSFLGGFYRGAMYAIRSRDQKYLLGEVNGPINSEGPPLVAPRAFAFSPFAGEEEGVIYVGGFDANYMRTHDTAWVFRAPVETVLGNGDR
jgi:hypothetical protein